MTLMELAREMGKEIQASTEFKALQSAKLANDTDESLQDQIGAFNLKRIELNTEMAAEKKSDDKIKALNTELQALYGQIMANEHMASFNVAKQNIDKMMNDVTTILMMCVNGEDPETCQLPDSDCSGSCSSCSGCH